MCCPCSVAGSVSAFVEKRIHHIRLNAWLFLYTICVLLVLMLVFHLFLHSNCYSIRCVYNTLLFCILIICPDMDDSSIGCWSTFIILQPREQIHCIWRCTVKGKDAFSCSFHAQDFLLLSMLYVCKKKTVFFFALSRCI